jgi:hypothetical protein
LIFLSTTRKDEDNMERDSACAHLSRVHRYSPFPNTASSSHPNQIRLQDYANSKLVTLVDSAFLNHTDPQTLRFLYSESQIHL